MKLKYKGYAGTVYHYPESDLYRVKIRRGLRWVCNLTLSGAKPSEIESYFREEVDSYLKSEI